VAGVDVGRTKRGRNDSAFKLWLILRDTRTASDGRVLMLGYWWAAPNADGVTLPHGTVFEATSSRRNVVLSTLPEAWLIAVGGPTAMNSWQTVHRDLVADLRSAYPGVPPESMQVVGITLQTDSEDTHGSSEVFLESVRITPSRGARSATSAGGQ
jgi:hypothetical protein